MIGAFILAPLALVIVVEQDSKSAYTAAYIDVPFAEGSLTVELLPDFIAIQRVRHLKSKGIAFNRFSASSEIVPTIRRSFNPARVPYLEMEWVYVKALIAIISLILLIVFIALFKERGVGKTGDR